MAAAPSLLCKGLVVRPLTTHIKPDALWLRDRAIFQCLEAVAAPVHSELVRKSPRSPRLRGIVALAESLGMRAPPGARPSFVSSASAAWGARGRIGFCPQPWDSMKRQREGRQPRCAARRSCAGGPVSSDTHIVARASQRPLAQAIGGLEARHSKHFA